MDHPSLWHHWRPDRIDGALPAAGIAVGLVAAAAVHFWASALTRKRDIRRDEAPSYIGKYGVVTKTIYSLDYGRMNLEGRVQIDGDRDISAITVGTTKKVELPKGTRVRIVAYSGAQTVIVEPDGNFTGGYMLNGIYQPGR
ncbi:NfeD family protein [Arthrobacter sp. ATA002]|uniref:NfeD family protein n=1 Tax=Arthrobacter sp. ATA002 TaxID=2991715 RepID=UPI0022A67684|nr:NfeD family protein [Arthrobacter sp. ATA002]WAP50840.1 NfeD family protein [Arthrobacter sp. ATA002]